MLKIEELTFLFIHQLCDIEKDIILTNHFHADWEADIFVISEEGFSHEIEIKYSKSDFKNDFKKSYTNTNSGEKFLKHDKISSGDYVCNFFSFLIPMGLVSHSEIPEHCGIIEFYTNPDNGKTEFSVERKPKQIHNQNYWELTDNMLLIRKLSLNYFYKKIQLKGKFEELILPNPIEIK